MQRLHSGNGLADGPPSGAPVTQEISARCPSVELSTAVLFGSTAGVVGLSWELPAFLSLAAMGLALGMHAGRASATVPSRAEGHC